MTLSEFPAFRTLDAKAAEELQLAAMETGLESLAAEDTFSTPVYCDPQGAWSIFVSQDHELDLHQMDHEGRITRSRGIVPRRVPLLVPEGEGKKLFIDYLSLLNRRDSVLGHAYYLIDDCGYEDSLSNVYYGALATSALDLLWRCSLLAYIWARRLDLRAGVRKRSSTTTWTDWTRRRSVHSYEPPRRPENKSLKYCTINRTR